MATLRRTSSERRLRNADIVMLKSKGRRRGRRLLQATTPPSNQDRQPSAFYRFLKALDRTLGRVIVYHWRLLGAASIVVGFLAGAFFFLPRVAVDPGSASDPSDPFSATFIVANTGMIPLENVSAAFAICWVTFRFRKLDSRVPKVVPRIPDARELSDDGSGCATDLTEERREEHHV
jgi:hypothetical protein